MSQLGDFIEEFEVEPVESPLPQEQPSTPAPQEEPVGA